MVAGRTEARERVLVSEGMKEECVDVCEEWTVKSGRSSKGWQTSLSWTRSTYHRCRHSLGCGAQAWR